MVIVVKNGLFLNRGVSNIRNNCTGVYRNIAKNAGLDPFFGKVSGITAHKGFSVGA